MSKSLLLCSTAMDVVLLWLGVKPQYLYWDGLKIILLQ